jgi:hypothetical protein
MFFAVSLRLSHSQTCRRHRHANVIAGTLLAGRPVISIEKTASASESLAHNLAANATNGEETVHANYHGPARGTASSALKKPVWGMKRPRPPWLIILNVFVRMRTALSFIGASCDPFPRFWPVCSCLPLPLHWPTAASSSSPTRRMVTASTNASLGAKNAARMPPCPIAGRGICRGLVLPARRLR